MKFGGGENWFRIVSRQALKLTVFKVWVLLPRNRITIYCYFYIKMGSIRTDSEVWRRLVISHGHYKMERFAECVEFSSSVTTL